MRAIDCNKCAHKKVCDLLKKHTGRNASTFCLEGCDYYEQPTLTPPNEEVSHDELPRLQIFG